MKRKLFFLVMCLGIGFMYSQPRVSLEHNGTTTIYVGNSAFVQAFTAAVDGDFIYLPGGTFEVPSFDKKVTIITVTQTVDKVPRFLIESYFVFLMVFFY